MGDDFALVNNKSHCTLTAVLALLRDFEGVPGAKRNKSASGNNNNSPQGAGVAMANISNKPMMERECFGCGNITVSRGETHN